MGLDGVEIVLAVEDAFHIVIQDEDAKRIATPGQLVDHIVDSVAATASGACLEQRAFYRIRASAINLLGLPRAAVKPDASWDSLLPGGHSRAAWRKLREASGLSSWPPLGLLGGLDRDTATVGGTARYVAARSPDELRPSGERWSRPQVEATVRVIIADVTGITEFEWNQEFAKDLGID